jgi:hypothetical protein
MRISTNLSANMLYSSQNGILCEMVLGLMDWINKTCCFSLKAEFYVDAVVKFYGFKMPDLLWRE